MKRLMVIAMPLAALAVSLQIGLAQQLSFVTFSATTDADLRTWDQFVTVQQRTGSLRVTQISQDPSLPSRTVERMQQYYEGIPVWGAEVVRDTSGGVAVAIFGSLSPQPDLDTRPGMTTEAAGQMLLSRMAAGATLLRPMTLVVLARQDGSSRLAYTTAVASANRVFRVFVDATSGAELLRYSSIETQSAVGTGQGLVGGPKKVSTRLQAGAYLSDDVLRPPVLTTYDMRGSFRRALNVLNGGLLFTSDIGTDSDNVWTDIPTIDAHTYIGWSYDYYYKRHGRRGLDNHDRPIVSMVNGVWREDAIFVPPDVFGDFVVNAFWCADCGPGATGILYFGNGFPDAYVDGDGRNWGYLAGSIDVVAHELTHAVTSSSSDLIYLNESGALNESFSDMMGTSVEFFYQTPGPGLGQADYLVGEDSVRSYRGGPNGIRSMMNPIAFGDPDHYSLRYTGTDDNGGVHTNSGIPNHAFYLAIEGGRNRVSGITVQGVGAANREQIEKAFYRAFVFLMPSSANFSTARVATIQAARDLYGSNSAAMTAIMQAWSAVGVN